jgi:hypothetical protein
MPGPDIRLTREQVRARRILSSGLARSAPTPGALPVWDLGVQDRDGSARVALAASLADPASIPQFGDPAAANWTAMAWTLRGAPHLHRRSDLPRIPAALWPLDAADAAARLGGDAQRLKAAGPTRSRRTSQSPRPCGR